MNTAAGKQGRGATEPPIVLGRVFAMGAGLLLGCALLKFGNPVILDHLIEAPRRSIEWVFQPWPAAYGYFMLGALLLAALPMVKLRWERKHWPLLLFVAWLVWQFVSATRTVSMELTRPTLVHFASCAVMLALGYFVFPQVRDRRGFWLTLAAAFAAVLFFGFDQRNGGLEAMRKAFYEMPDWQSQPKDFYAKIASNRIFSTLVYPNALAGAIILLFPPLTWALINYSKSWPRIARGVVLGLFIYLSLACLYWTGSKAGWLIALACGAFALLSLKFPVRYKWSAIAAILILGLGAFFVRYQAYFKKGAPSAGARFVYWEAALKIATERPAFGSGPGTFQAEFRKIKPPEAEMAKLVHNDYLEQAADSGWFGAVTFTAFAGLSLFGLYRNSSQKGELFWVYLGVFGVLLQGLVEFGLYIPAISWPGFFFIGWLWAENRSAT